MSGTTTPPAPANERAVQQPPQSATNQATTQGTAASAVGISAAIVGLGASVLKHYGWTVSLEDMGYATTLVTVAVHYAIVRLKVVTA